MSEVPRDVDSQVHSTVDLAKIHVSLIMIRESVQDMLDHNYGHSAPVMGLLCQVSNSLNLLEKQTTMIRRHLEL